MSNEREVINLTKSTNPISEAERKEYEARITSVLSRGILTDKLKVELPNDMHGEWVYNDATAITNKKLIGFDIDETYAPKNALHTDASGKPIIGDTIFMTIPRWKFEIFEKARQKKYDEHHGVRAGKSAEERNFETEANRNETPAINKSSTVNADIKKIAEV